MRQCANAPPQEKMDGGRFPPKVYAVQLQQVEGEWECLRFVSMAAK
jgi:hypothetical protein